MPAISKIFKTPWKWSSWVKKLFKKFEIAGIFGPYYNQNCKHNRSPLYTFFCFLYHFNCVDWITRFPWPTNFTVLPGLRLFKAYNLYFIASTLTAIIFLHYRVATKMALEILGYPMCRVQLWWLVSLPLEVSKLVYARLEGVELFF